MDGFLLLLLARERLSSRGLSTQGQHPPLPLLDLSQDGGTRFLARASIATLVNYARTLKVLVSPIEFKLLIVDKFKISRLVEDAILLFCA